MHIIILMQLETKPGALGSSPCDRWEAARTLNKENKGTDRKTK